MLDQDSLPIARRLKERQISDISIPEDEPEPPSWYELAIEQDRRNRQASRSPEPIPLNGSQVLSAASGHNQPGEVQASVAELIRRMLVTPSAEVQEGRSE